MQRYSNVSHRVLSLLSHSFPARLPGKETKRRREGERRKSSRREGEGEREKGRERERVWNKYAEDQKPRVSGTAAPV